MAANVEHELTKHQLLASYLNVAYFENNAYGIQVAAERYFQTTRAQADPAASPRCWPAWWRTPPPTTRSPSPATTRNRRNLVLARMAQLGTSARRRPRRPK